MEENKIVTSAAPASNPASATEPEKKKIRKQPLHWMLIDVIIALAPTTLLSYLVFGVYAIRNILIPVAVMVGAELIFVLIKNRKTLFSKDEKTKKSFKEVLNLTDILSPIISGMIFGLMTQSCDTNPTWLIYFILIVSSLFGIVFGKLVFGGLGRNIFNPAAVSFVFMLICWGSKFTGAYHYNAWGLPFLPEVASFSASATPLSQSAMTASLYGWENIQALFFGNVTGGMGESCKITLLLGLAYLLIRKDADWRVVVSFALTFLAMSLIGGLFFWGHDSSINPLNYTLYQFLSGGVLFGMAFMMVDPVTMPLTSPSRVIYGMVLALFVVFIRTFASAPEGMAYAILMGNAVGCFIDYYKWSQTKFTWKVWVAIACIAVLGLGLFAWAMNGYNYGTTAMVMLGGAL